MAEKRKKSTSRSSKQSSKSSNTRKKAPKVKLSTKYVFLLTLVIIIMCGGLLGVAGYLASARQSGAQEQKIVKQTSPAVKTKPAPSSQTGKMQPETSVKKMPENKKTAAVPQKNIQVPKPQVKSAVSKQPETKTYAAPEKSVSIQKPDTSKAVTVAKAVSVKPVEDQNKIKDPFSLPPAKNGATVVFIIDDAGLNVANVKRYANLPMPLTIAVLPKLSGSKGCAYVVRSSGKELILHQPMQAQNLNVNPGPGAVTIDMGTLEIERLVKENIDEIGPGVKGVNNHEGSLITANEIKIGAVLEACSSKGVYFLDSRTTVETKAKMAALEHDTKFFEKAGPYIDNVTTRAAELERIKESLEYANRHGVAIVIGHVDKSVEVLPDLLAELYPWMVKAGYKFATPSTLK